MSVRRVEWLAMSERRKAARVEWFTMSEKRPALYSEQPFDSLRSLRAFASKRYV